MLLRHGDLLYLDILAGGRMDVDDAKSPLEMARRRTNSSFGSAVSLPGVERDSSGTPVSSSMMSESGRYYTESARRSRMWPKTKSTSPCGHKMDPFNVPKTSDCKAFSSFFSSALCS